MTEHQIVILVCGVLGTVLAKMLNFITLVLYEKALMSKRRRMFKNLGAAMGRDIHDKMTQNSYARKIFRSKPS